MSERPPLPSHAYVPGRNRRHPEGAFDVIRETVSPEMGIEELARCGAWRAGLLYLQEGYFWEAHEVLEPVWMACPPNSVARSVAQGLIQLANARLKLKMERPDAALKLFHIAKDHLKAAGGALTLGLDAAKWVEEIDSEIDEIKSAI